MEGTRLNLAYVFQSMASACCHLSRGRRELGRRFVPIESANVLFKNKPSHYCIFGFDSIKAATDNSAEVKNVNKELVHIQKKRKFFRTSQKFKPWHQSRDKFDSFRGKFHKGRRGKGNRGHRGKGRGKKAYKPKEKGQE